MVQDNPVIALVDDDEELRRGLAKFLERENFTVRHGVSCEDARALAQAADVDLMVLDRLLPDGDSVHAASDIRSQTDIPIIILSGVGQTSERVIGLDAGAGDEGDVGGVGADLGRALLVLVAADIDLDFLGDGLRARPTLVSF